jgi:hypothetical protein
MRVMLAVTIAFSLVLPLSAGVASAARGHRAIPLCPKAPPVTRQVCLCEQSGGRPLVFYFPFSTPQILCLAPALR